jgi:alkylmercury lyase
MQTAPTIDQVADKLVAAAPKLDETDQRIGIALQRRLAHGAPVTANGVANDVELPEAKVADALDRVPVVYRDDEDRVVGFFGLSVIEMGDHRVHLDGHTLSTWLAWDTLIIPELLGRTLEVTSRSPGAGDPISLAAAPEGPRNVSPPETVVSFLMPGPEMAHDVIKTFCHYVHFFPSTEAAEPWFAEHPNTFVVSLEDAYQLGHVLTQAAFGDVTPERPGVTRSEATANHTD